MSFESRSWNPLLKQNLRQNVLNPPIASQFRNTRQLLLQSFKNPLVIATITLTAISLIIFMPVVLTFLLIFSAFKVSGITVNHIFTQITSLFQIPNGRRDRMDKQDKAPFRQ